MDIHKPKAVHTWREFLIEIGTIICGVLIALALEQLVAWMHDQHELRESREALSVELSTDAAALRAMAEEDACTDARLRLLEAWASGKAKVDSSNFASMENRPRLWTLQMTVWAETQAGGAAAHMPVRERLDYADVYDQLANQMRHILDERSAWDLLARHAGEQALDVTQARTVRADIGAIRIRDADRQLNTPSALDAIARLGVKPAPPPRGRDSKLLCGPPA